MTPLPGFTEALKLWGHWQMTWLGLVLDGIESWKFLALLGGLWTKGAAWLAAGQAFVGSRPMLPLSPDRRLDVPVFEVQNQALDLRQRWSCQTNPGAPRGLGLVC